MRVYMGMEALMRRFIAFIMLFGLGAMANDAPLFCVTNMTNMCLPAFYEDKAGCIVAEEPAYQTNYIIYNDGHLVAFGNDSKENSVTLDYNKIPNQAGNMMMAIDDYFFNKDGLSGQIRVFENGHFMSVIMTGTKIFVDAGICEPRADIQ